MVIEFHAEINITNLLPGKMINHSRMAVSQQYIIKLELTQSNFHKTSNETTQSARENEIENFMCNFAFSVNTCNDTENITSIMSTVIIRLGILEFILS